MHQLLKGRQMKQRLVLISCVSKKLAKRAIARDLYISTLFRLNLKYAETLKPCRILILSAKYGLLELNQEVEPYEQTLNNMRVSEVNHWASQVLQQIKSISSVEEAEYIFLAGERYRKYLIPHMRFVQIPLKGYRIGEQLSKLKELTSEH